MKKTLLKAMSLVLVLALVLISCEGSLEEREVTIEVPSESRVVTPCTVVGPVNAVAVPVPGMKTMKVSVPDGEYAVSYLDGTEQKVALMTVRGNDVSFTLPSAGSDVPCEVWASMEAGKDGIHVSLMVFFENGTGSRMKLDFALDDPGMKNPVAFDAKPVAWKKSGTALIFSDGTKPQRGSVMNGILDVLGKEYVKEGGETGKKSADGIWNVFTMGSIAEGKRTLLSSVIKIEGNDVSLRAQADLAGLPAEEGWETGIAAQASVSFAKLRELSEVLKTARFSEDGSIMVLDIAHVKIPLLRAKASSEVPDFEGELYSKDFTVTLFDLAAAIENTVVDEEKKVTVGELLGEADIFLLADRTGVLRDVSGRWTAGKDTWYAASGLVWSPTADRFIFLDPAEDGRPACTELRKDGTLHTVIFDIGSWTETEGSVTVEVSNNGKTASFVRDAKAQPAVSAELDALLGMFSVNGNKLSLRNVSLSLNGGILSASAFGKSVPLGMISMTRDRAAFTVELTGDAIIKIITDNGGTAPSWLPDVSFTLTAPLENGKLKLMDTPYGPVLI